MTVQDARDRAQAILGAVSLVIWLVVAFTLGIIWFIDEDTPQPILLAGGFALMIAALPWLFYKPLVRRISRDGAHRPPSRSSERV